MERSVAKKKKQQQQGNIDPIGEVEGLSWFRKIYLLN